MRPTLLQISHVAQAHFRDLAARSTMIQRANYSATTAQRTALRKFFHDLYTQCTGAT